MVEDLGEQPLAGRPRKGRGAVSTRDGRYEPAQRQAVDDGWGSAEEEPPRLATTLSVDTARRAITYNDSPDIPFDRSINPYCGREHRRVYCFARPTHACARMSTRLNSSPLSAYSTQSSA